MKPKIHLCTTSTLDAMFPFYSHDLMLIAKLATSPEFEAHRRCYTGREKPSEFAAKDNY